MPFYTAQHLVNKTAIQAALYEAVLAIIGATGIIIPIGDSKHDVSAGAGTFSAVGEIQSTFTYSEAVASFDTPPTIQGVVPVVIWNGTDEEADTVDNIQWTVDDNAGANGFSIGIWCFATNTAAARALLTKFDGSTVNREWIFQIDASDLLSLGLFDDSASARERKNSDSAITMGAWKFFSVTYDGAGGTSASAGITLYQDGAAIAGTADDTGTYVGMENGASLAQLAHQKTSGVAGNFYNGRMAGGPIGPFFTKKQLTADEHLRLFELGQGALNL